jgi:antitoxin HicB
MRTEYSYPARIEQDEEGRYQVRFTDLPDALTDGADRAEAIIEAADCLSAALASRIIDGEDIPKASSPAPGQELVSPDPTIALKAALYEALRRQDMTVADLADRLGVADWHQAARLLDPRRSSKLTSLAAALDAVGCRIAISIEPAPRTIQATASFSASESLSVSLSDATLRAVAAHGEGATAKEIMNYLDREFGMTVRPNHLGIALQRHCRAGRLENRDGRWYAPPAQAPARSAGA